MLPFQLPPAAQEVSCSVPSASRGSFPSGWHGMSSILSSPWVLARKSKTQDSQHQADQQVLPSPSSWIGDGHCSRRNHAGVAHLSHALSGSADGTAVGEGCCMPPLPGHPGIGWCASCCVQRLCSPLKRRQVKATLPVRLTVHCGSHREYRHYLIRSRRH